MDADTDRLERLADTALYLDDSTQDVRGRKALDANGDEIGTVEDLLIDSADRKVRFLDIASGGFLGVGAKHFLVPVDAIARIDNASVHLTNGRQHVADAPTYAPHLADRRYLMELYSYYGVQPFWLVGYSYPTMPYYA